MNSKTLNALFDHYETSPTRFILWLEEIGADTKNLHSTVSLHRTGRNKISKSYQGLYISYFKMLQLQRVGKITRDEFYSSIK